MSKWLTQYGTLLLNQWPNIAVALSLSLVLALVHRFALIEKVSYPMTIQVETISSLQPLYTPEMDAFVTLSAESRYLREINSEDIVLFVKAQGIDKEGLYQRNVEVYLKNPDLFRYVQLEYRPQRLTFFLEKVLERRIPVTPTLIDSLKPGQVIEFSRLTPSHLVVLGPTSIVNQLSALVTKPISLADRDGDFVETVKPDLDVTKSRNLTILSGSELLFEARLTRDNSTTLNLANLPIRVENLAPHLSLSVELPGVSLNILQVNQRRFSSIQEINRLRGEVSFSVNLRGLDQAGSYSVPVTLHTQRQGQIFEFSPQIIEVQLVDIEKQQQKFPSEGLEGDVENVDESSPPIKNENLPDSSSEESLTQEF